MLIRIEQTDKSYHMHKLEHTTVTVEHEPKRRNSIEIPLWMLPDELQQLHDELQEARNEVRALEHKFRNGLHRFLSVQAGKEID